MKEDGREDMGCDLKRSLDLSSKGRVVGHRNGWVEIGWRKIRRVWWNGAAPKMGVEYELYVRDTIVLCKQSL